MSLNRQAFQELLDRLEAEVFLGNPNFIQAVEDWIEALGIYNNLFP